MPVRASKKAVTVVSVAAVRWSLACIFVICMGTSFVVAAQAGDRDNKVAANTLNLCLVTNKAANGTNAVLDALIISVSETGSIPAAEKKIRVARYTSYKVPLIPCGHLALKP